MTTTTAQGTFTLDQWDQHDDDPAAGTTFGRAQVTKTFGGDLVGTSTTRLLLIGTESGARAYCGFEQVTGTVAERTGTFLLRHAAEGAADGGWMTWQVVPRSGTGELAGVSGEGKIDRHPDGSHSYLLTLMFGEPG